MTGTPRPKQHLHFILIATTTCIVAITATIGITYYTHRPDSTHDTTIYITYPIDTLSNELQTSIPHDTQLHDNTTAPLPWEERLEDLPAHTTLLGVWEITPDQLYASIIHTPQGYALVRFGQERHSIGQPQPLESQGDSLFYLSHQRATLYLEDDALQYTTKQKTEIWPRLY